MSLRWMNKGRNLIIAASMLTPSTEKSGVVGPGVKAGTGSAVAESGGAYTGPEDTVYTVEIDSISGGTEIGEATFRWKGGGTSWEATGVSTSSGPLELSHGVSLKFSPGAGPDFALGDTWEFLAVKPFGRAKLLDLDRNTAWRTAGLDEPNFVVADLGEAQTVKAAVLGDHNFSSPATIKLQAHPSDVWDAPAFEQVLSHHPGRIVYFLDETYRYWRLVVSDGDNAEGYLRLGEFFLGSYLELSSGVVTRDFGRALVKTDPDVEAREVFHFSLHVCGAADRDALLDFFRVLRDTETNQEEPFFFCWAPEEPSASSRLVFLESEPSLVNTYKDYHQFELSLIEAPRANV